MTVRLKLTFSYAGFLMAAALVLCAVTFAFLLRYIPEGDIRVLAPGGGSTGWVPDRSDLLRAFLPPACWALLFLGLAGLVGGWFLAGRVLRPLATIGEAAQRAARGSLSHRIHLPGPRDELRELADVFDTMLARLERHVDEQQRFAANASHELRTPLSITRTVLEVAQADPTADMEAVLQRLRHVNERAIQTTESLLLLSRLDRQPFEQETVDLAVITREAVETLHGLSGHNGIAVITALLPATTRGNPVLLRRLAANLIHNAIVHNHARDASVWVRTEPHPDGGAQLIVENTGDVVPPETLATLTEPFERGERRARRSGHEHAGAGLGLAISTSIVGLHSGRFTLHARPAGGLRVEATLQGPSAPPRRPPPEGIFPIST